MARAISFVGRGHRAASMAAVVLALVACFFAVPLLVGHSPTRQFCSLSLAVGTVNGEKVALEDQGPPGRGVCDGNAVGMGNMNTLGFDCNVRNTRGVVVATTTPNQRGGTCGQPDR